MLDSVPTLATLPLNNRPNKLVLLLFMYSSVHSLNTLLEKPEHFSIYAFI